MQTALGKMKADWLPLHFDGTSTPVKTVLFVVVCVAWLVPGLAGHEPWKFDGAVALGVVEDMLRRGDWVVPSLAGEALPTRPPLFHWVAAVLVRLFGGVMPHHDAAGLASGLFMALAMVFAALAGREFFGPRHGRLPVLILIGCVGLLIHAHETTPDTAQLAGFAIALYGFALAARSAGLGGAVAGSGTGIAFMSHGLAPLLSLGLGTVVLAWAVPSLRRHWWPRFLPAYCLALLPWAALWPAALHARAPDVFAAWLWEENLSRVVGIAGIPPNLDLAYYPSILLWYAWPALPIAAWDLWRRGIDGPLAASRRFLIGLAVCMLALLCLTPGARETSAMPLLLPLALLASPAIDRLDRGAASALDWFGIMTFGLFSALLWLGWFALVTGEPEPATRVLSRYLSGFRLDFDLAAFVTAFVLSAMWVAAVLRTRQSNRRAAVNWAAGITLLWLLAMTLWLPFIDAARSYRGVVLSLAAVLDGRGGCIASAGLGDPQRALFAYYANITTERIESRRGTDCRLLLVQGKSEARASGGQWQQIWTGSRAGDRDERFALYRRD